MTLYTTSPGDEREAFEAWAISILGDNPTWRESGDCELAWQAWQARASSSTVQQVGAELTGEQWSVSRSEFIRWANRYEDAKTADAASVIADIAGADIYRAVLRASYPKSEQGDQQ